jgi:hypothetical protein
VFWFKSFGASLGLDPMFAEFGSVCSFPRYNLIAAFKWQASNWFFQPTRSSTVDCDDVGKELCTWNVEPKQHFGAVRLVRGDRGR